MRREQYAQAQKILDTASNISNTYRKFLNQNTSGQKPVVNRKSPGVTPRGSTIINRVKQQYAQDPVILTLFLHSLAVKRALINLSPDPATAQQQIVLLCHKILNILEIQRPDLRTVVQAIMAPESTNA